MSSLTSPGLIKAANEALVKAAPELNSARLFAYDMSPDFSDYGLVVKVPIVASGSISAFNESTNDYENSDGTISWATVTLSCQPKSTFDFSGKDILEAPNAPYWNQCAEAAANGIRSYVSQAIGANFLSTEITATTTLTGDLTMTKLAKLRNQCLARIADTVLVLSPDLYAETLGLFSANVFGSDEPVRNGYVGNLYGFKAVMQCKDMPTGIKGALVPTNAIAVASRAVTVGDIYPYSEYGTVSDEFGFTLTFLRHGSARTGKGYINCTSLFGVKTVQPDMIKLII